MNFVHRDFLDDIDLIFGPVSDDDVFEIIDDSTKMEDLVISLGKFKSKTQARKNGWGGEIPWGFNDFKIGKTFFWVWKPRTLDPIVNMEILICELIEEEFPDVEFQ